MRRALLMGLCTVLLVPSSALGAGSVGYQYLTTYSGTYDFTDHFRPSPNAPDANDSQQMFQWVDYEYQTIIVHPDHTFTQTLTSYIRALGDDKSVSVQGPGLTTTAACHVYSDSTPVVTKGGGDYIQPVLVQRNPLIHVEWMLPDYGGAPRRDVPQFHVSGTADCRFRTSTFLFNTPTQNDGTVFARPNGDLREFADAFSGDAMIHYRQLPWSRPFNVTLQDTATSGSAVDTAKVVVDSRVRFERTLGTTLPDAPPSKRNKIADLLINEGFGGFDLQSPPGGPPIGASGDPDTVVVPGLGPGEVSLDVTGTVLPKGQARDAAAGGVLLASARTRVRSGGAPVRLKIVPSATGRRLLKAAHGAFRARYTLSIKPAGSRRTYRGVKTFAVPAVP